MNENTLHCKSISEELTKIYNGEYYAINEESSEYFTNYEEIDNEDFTTSYKILDGYYEGDIVEDEPIQVDFWNYFNDVYDIEYTIGSDKQYRGVRLMVACGGPDIYINTMTKQVELYWWGDNASYYIPSEVCEEIDALFEEYYNCL